VDEQGRRHFSDTPVEGATQIEISGTQTFEGGLSTPSPAPQAATESEEEPFSYSVLELLTPADQEVLFNIEGNLNVELVTYPQLQRNHHIQVILDGERLGIQTRDLALTIPEVWRGEHVLQLVIVGADGEDLKQSMPATFYVRQNSILNPQRAR
jgi:hypothetical protein